MGVKLGDKVYHKDIYNGRELMEIVGIRKNEVELEGDYSGGTHNVKQKDWMPLNGLINENDEKFKRLFIVNDLIRIISFYGRGFFKNGDNIASLHLDSYDQVWYIKEWVSSTQPHRTKFVISEEGKMSEFHHGGTLLALIREFREFILTGEKPEYSVLNSDHWGYSESDMSLIQARAVTLEYL